MLHSHRNPSAETDGTANFFLWTISWRNLFRIWVKKMTRVIFLFMGQFKKRKIVDICLLLKSHLKPMECIMFSKNIILLSKMFMLISFTVDLVGTCQTIILETHSCKNLNAYVCNGIIHWNADRNQFMPVMDISYLPIVYWICQIRMICQTFHKIRYMRFLQRFRLLNRMISFHKII